VKVKGDATLHAPVEQVWKALNDPAVLVRTIPGCEQLEEVGQDRYRMTINAGVASIKGTYQGDVSLADQNPPGSFVLKASGAGAPGTVSADIKVSLVDDGSGGTRLDYDADAIVGGVIGGVGQRMLTGVAKKTAGEFFKAVDDVLTGKAVEAPALAEVAAAPEGAAAAAPGAGPKVFRAPAAAAAPGGGQDFMKGAVFGAVVALLGALIGGLIARRRA
jgi:carbon monoxide dehydrogenase subunit G